LILGYNLKRFFVDMRIAQDEDSAKNIISLARIIPRTHVEASYAELVQCIYRLQRV